MKKIKIFAAIIFVQLVAVLALTVYNNSSLSKAVVWNVSDYKLTAVKLHGADGEQLEKLNSEIRAKLDSFTTDENAPAFSTYTVLSDSKNMSVVEITTDLREYDEAKNSFATVGQVKSRLFVFVDNGEVKTDWQKQSTLSKVIGNSEE